MKNRVSMIVSFWMVILTITACSSSRDVEVVPSLYKTAEGKSIAIKSYDKALSLFSGNLMEEYIPTDYG